MIECKLIDLFEKKTYILYSRLSPRQRIRSDYSSETISHTFLNLSLSSDEGI